jgi:DNA-binding MarR family transcriptional regulator
MWLPEFDKFGSRQTCGGNQTPILGATASTWRMPLPWRHSNSDVTKGKFFMLEPISKFINQIVAKSEKGLVDRDLSARQLAIFLMVYTSDDVLSVKDFAELLDLERPVVSRAIQRLQHWGLVKIAPAADKLIDVKRTPEGRAYFKTLNVMWSKAIK